MRGAQDLDSTSGSTSDVRDRHLTEEHGEVGWKGLEHVCHGCICNLGGVCSGVLISFGFSLAHELDLWAHLSSYNIHQATVNGGILAVWRAGFFFRSVL